MLAEIVSTLVSTPDTCGGKLRIEGTRITLNQIVTLYKQGETAEEIAGQYPQLTLSQVYSALAYYHSNKTEVELDLDKEKNEAEKLAHEFARGL